MRNPEAFADMVVDCVKRTVEGPKVQGRLAELEHRIKLLESRPLLKWAGVHVAGQPYQEAQLVTRQGSLWVSTAPTFTTPGAPGSAWRLVVKKGSV